MDIHLCKTYKGVIMKDTEKIVTALHLAPQLNIDKMTNEIFVIRQQTINNAIMKQLQDLMHEKGITELYAIDESKVLQLIKEHNALEIIKNKEIDIKAFNDLSNLEEYNYYCEPELTQEEYDLLKGILYEKED